MHKKSPTSKQTRVNASLQGGEYFLGQPALYTQQVNNSLTSIEWHVPVSSIIMYIQQN